MLKVKHCWHYLLQADIIKFFVTRVCQKIQQVDKNRWNSSYWQRNSFYLLNHLRNFHEIFWKDVNYNDKIFRVKFQIAIFYTFLTKKLKKKMSPSTLQYPRSEKLHTVITVISHETWKSLLLHHFSLSAQ